jgi:hypothetical protein
LEARRADQERLAVWIADMTSRERRVLDAGYRALDPTTADLRLSDGGTMAGLVTVTQVGLLVEENWGRQAFIPFDDLGEFRMEEVGDLRALCRMPEIAEVTLRPPQPDLWLDSFELRRADWWM